MTLCQRITTVVLDRQEHMTLCRPTGTYLKDAQQNGHAQRIRLPPLCPVNKQTLQLAQRLPVQCATARNHGCIADVFAHNAHGEAAQRTVQPSRQADTSQLHPREEPRHILLLDRHPGRLEHRRYKLRPVGRRAACQRSDALRWRAKAQHRRRRRAASVTAPVSVIARARPLDAAALGPHDMLAGDKLEMPLVSWTFGAVPKTIAAARLDLVALYSALATQLASAAARDADHGRCVTPGSVGRAN